MATPPSIFGAGPASFARASAAEVRDGSSLRAAEIRRLDEKKGRMDA
jgi:hypothetical protein